MSEHGLCVLDKPAGLSSTEALAPVKLVASKGTKVGHAGTLDPFATGVLLVLMGEATRLSHLAMGLRKTYRATVRFGSATDTLDPDGAVVAERDPGAAMPPGLAGMLPSGEIEQVPPIYSALRVEGKRAYQLARAGKTPSMKARRVMVYDARIVGTRWPDIDVEIVSGAGFYVRSFARDLGEAVGLPAHLAALRRTHVGPFSDGVAPEAFSMDRLLPPFAVAEAAGLPVAELSRDDAIFFAEGRRLPLTGEGMTAVRTGTLFVGLGVAGPDGLDAKTVFASARRALEGRV